MQPQTPEQTLIYLKSQFPNLEWIGSKHNRDNFHAFTASFHDWEFQVEVLPIGCRAILKAERQAIASSPNEQDKTLVEVIGIVKDQWGKTAKALEFGDNS